MTIDEVLRRRIARHFLGGAKAADPVEVARRVGGVHAQVAASAAEAVRLRTRRAPDLDRALYTDRTLVRTWAARGTLHLLPAADLPAWVAVMSTRTRETTGSWLTYHGVAAGQMTALLAAAPDVLGAEPLTRGELADGLIAAVGDEDLRGPLTQGFGAILKPLAFRGLLCSGPPRGRNVTFVAPRAWLGPAPDEETVLLLPAFDPYTVGSLRQLDTVSTGPKTAVSRPQGWISPVLVVNGRIVGTWEPSPKTGVPAVTPFGKLPNAVRRALPEVTITR